MESSMLNLDLKHREAVIKQKNHLLDDVRNKIGENPTSNFPAALEIITERMKEMTAGRLSEGIDMDGCVQEIFQCAAEFHRECNYPMAPEEFRSLIRENAHRMELDQARCYIGALRLSCGILSSENAIKHLKDYTISHEPEDFAQRLHEKAKSDLESLDTMDAIDNAIDLLDLDRCGSGLMQQHSAGFVRDALQDTPGRTLAEIELACREETFEAAVEACALYAQTLNGHISSLDKTTTPRAVTFLYMSEYEFKQARRMYMDNEIDYDCYTARMRSIARASAHGISFLLAHAPFAGVAGMLLKILVPLIPEAPIFIGVILAVYIPFYYWGTGGWRDFINLDIKNLLYQSIMALQINSQDKKRAKDVQQQAQRLLN